MWGKLTDADDFEKTAHTCWQYCYRKQLACEQVHLPGARQGRVPEVGQVAEEVAALHHAHPGVVPALAADREHAPRAVGHVLCRVVRTRRRLKPGVADPGRALLTKKSGKCFRVGNFLDAASSSTPTPGYITLTYGRDAASFAAVVEVEVSLPPVRRIRDVFVNVAVLVEVKFNGMKGISGKPARLVAKGISSSTAA